MRRKVEKPASVASSRSFGSCKPTVPSPRSCLKALVRFHSALNARGVHVISWFDKQLDPCTIGMLATFGWEKAVDDDNKLR